MKKFLLVILCLNVGISLVYGQAIVNQFDHSKYWYYRYRLTHEFLKKGAVDYACIDPQNGPATGYSIPASRTSKADNGVYWGDGTTRLGWYMATLATEYRLLKNYGQSTMRTEQELYYAMKAYERLDFHSGSFYAGLQTSCATDGFFSRDDVNQAFIDKEFTGKNYSSDYKDDGKENRIGRGIVSIDQVSHLFIGFALVVKCVDSNASYDGYNFVSQAKTYTRLITNYLKGNNWQVPVPGTNPTQYASYSNEAKASSYGAAKAAERIVSGKWGSNLWSNGEFENAVSYSFSDVWQQHQLPQGYVALERTKNDYVRAIVHGFGAVGHSWRYGLVATKVGSACIKIPYPCPTWRNPLRFCHKNICAELWCYPKPLSPIEIPVPVPVYCAPFQLPTIAVNTTAFTLSKQGKQLHTEIFALLNQYLNNDGNYGIEQDFYKSAIHSAPCEGPYFYGTGTGVEWWRVGNRWEKSRRAKNGDPKFSGVEFSGLDYTLVYNLYFLVNKNQINVAAYENELNRAFNDYTFTTSKEYLGFETMSFSGNTTVNPDVNAVFKSPVIDLQPGFTVTVGANATFQTTTTGASGWKCNPTGTGYEPLNAQASPPSSEDTLSPVDTVQIRRDFEAYVTPLLAEEVNKINWDSLQALNCQYVPLSQYLNSAASRQGFDLINGQTVSANGKVYPNPFNQSFTLEFNVSGNQLVSFYLTDVYGKQVASLLDKKTFATGKHTVDFQLHQLPAGVYIYYLQIGQFSQVQKIVKLN